MTGARERADDEAGRLADDPELIRYIDQAWARLYAVYAKAHPDLYRTETELTTTGAAFIALPADFFGAIGVDYKAATNDYRKIGRLLEHERNRFTSPGASRALRYRVWGTSSRIYLYPTPPTGQVYRLVYLPNPARLTAGADSIDCLLGHEQYLEMLVAKRLLSKEESYDGRFEGDLKEFLEEIREEADMRELAEAAHVDIDGGEFSYDADDDWPRRRWGF